MSGKRGSDTSIFIDSHDKVADFAIHADQLILDDRNWRGGLDAQDVVDQYVYVADDNIVFVFGSDDILTLKRDHKSGRHRQYNRNRLSYLRRNGFLAVSQISHRSRHTDRLS